MSTKQLKDGSRFKSNCAICDKERYFDGLVGGECICNKCYKPFLYGLLKERKRIDSEEQQKLKQIHQLILEARDEALLSPTQYNCVYKDGTSGTNWIMIKKATKTMSKIHRLYD